MRHKLDEGIFLVNERIIELIEPGAVSGVYTKIGTTSSKMLQCSGHGGEDWCYDIEKIVVGNYDSWLIWGPPEAERNDLSDMELSVPLMPSQDIWADIFLGDTPTESGAYKVFYRGDGPGTSHKNAPFLGFFDRGEGRGVLRSMVYDWFRTEIALGNVTECRAKNHGLKSQQSWQNDMNGTDNTRFAQYWSVFSTNRCLGCRPGYVGTSVEMDDLIPDAGSNISRKVW